MTPVTTPSITIIGAGLAGSMMAIYLGQRGFNVDVYERRGDMRLAATKAIASMNLGLSRRGIQALTDIGLIDKVMQMAIPMQGRMIHTVEGERQFQSYGVDTDQVIYAIKRNDLNIALMDYAETCPNVRFHFDMRCIRLEKDQAIVHFHDEAAGREVSVQSDFIIGADGVFSTVRQQMQHGERANYQQEFLDWGWKELVVPPGPDGQPLMERNMFHLWPRGACMIFAHPNLDGSFCCSCLLPYQGEISFATLQTEPQVRAFFETLFKDLLAYSPTVVDNFLRNPIITLVSTRMDPWYYKNRVVLIGDSCHGVFPFYAQGMNAAFEDCATLNDCLGRHMGDWEAAFAEYQALRKRNTDALADMSRQNFIELRDKVRSPLLRTRKRIDTILSQIFPDAWMPLHAMVTHTTIPYAEALERAKWQDRVLKWLGVSTLLSAVLLAPKRRPSTDR